MIFQNAGINTKECHISDHNPNLS